MFSSMMEGQGSWSCILFFIIPNSIHKNEFRQVSLSRCKKHHGYQLNDGAPCQPIAIAVHLVMEWKDPGEIHRIAAEPCEISKSNHYC